MKEIKLRSIVKNSENEITNLETNGQYNENEKIITYYEEDLKNTIYISEDCVKINRKNEDYNLNLEFVLNEKKQCKYELKSVGLDIDLIVFTKTLEINGHCIYIHYDLTSEDQQVGDFEFKLEYWE